MPSCSMRQSLSKCAHLLSYLSAAWARIPLLSVSSGTDHGISTTALFGKERAVTFVIDLASLFRRDLSRLRRQIDSFPNGDAIWLTPPGVTNSAGNLVLHIEGNLREYIGRQLGNLAYVRNRPQEFSSKGLPKEELIRRIAALCRSIPSIVESISATQIDEVYPSRPPTDASVRTSSHPGIS